MGTYKDITGQRFGSLVAISRIGFRSRSSLWLCRCDCGKEVERLTKTLRDSTHHHSCGCMLGVITGNLKHGDCFSPTYNAWSSMRNRCTNLKVSEYKYYGARGIKVCERWRGEHGYKHFLADMGERPNGTTLDRIDYNGNYEPSNCRWATAIQQANNKRNNVVITHNGETHTMADWCRILGISNVSRARKRYARGLPFERVFANYSFK